MLVEVAGARDAVGRERNHLKFYRFGSLPKQGFCKRINVRDKGLSAGWICRVWNNNSREKGLKIMRKRGNLTGDTKNDHR